MKAFLYVGVGGAGGAVCRYLIQSIQTGVFPWATLFVNLIGSFLLGYITMSKSKEKWKLFFGTGFFGSFTTMSTFSAELYYLLMNDYLLFCTYLFASLAIGLVVAYLGMKCNERFH